MQKKMSVHIKTESINLDALLKWAGLVMTGGEAKMSVQQGLVRVNGVTETRRSRKIVAGDKVSFAGMLIEVTATEGERQGGVS